MPLPSPAFWLAPNWQPHPRVRTCITTRLGEFSPAPWQGFNLGLNCNDEANRVNEAREHVQQTLELDQIGWLTQVHGTKIVDASNELAEADACISHRANQACAILTADCLPVLFARDDGSAVAAAHAGWRGLADGILIKTAKRLAPNHESVSAWIGPAICQGCYQVDDKVRDAFLSLNPENANAFIDDGASHYRLSLSQVAEQQLTALNIAVTQSHLCTSCHNDRFYSYRKERGKTGRFVSLIWRI